MSPTRLFRLFFGTVVLVANVQLAYPQLSPRLGRFAAPVLQPGVLAQEPATQTQPAPSLPSPDATTQNAPSQGEPGKLNSWSPEVHIAIVQGDRGANILKKGIAVTPIVEVRDRNNLPLAGVLVLFSAPADGPSVTFLNGERTYSIVTDADGRAVLSGMKPVNPGSFQIHVSASYKSDTVEDNIALTNYLTSADAAAGGVTTGASRPGLSRTTLLVLVGVGVAAAAGIGIGLAGHGASSAASTSGSSSTTISFGSGATAGAPH